MHSNLVKVKASFVGRRVEEMPRRKLDTHNYVSSHYVAQNSSCFEIINQITICETKNYISIYQTLQCTVS